MQTPLSDEEFWEGNITSPQKLEHYYVDLGLSFSEIAEGYDVAEQVVSRWFDRVDITEAENSNQPNLREFWNSRPTDPDELSRLYRRRGYSLAELADRFDVSHDTISTWLDKADIDTRPPGTIPDAHFWRHRPTDPDELYQLYVEQSTTKNEIAEKFNISNSTVNQWLNRAGIDTGQEPSEFWGGRPTDPDELYQNYVNDDMTIREISEELEVPVSTIHEWLKRIGVLPHVG